MWDSHHSHHLTHHKQLRRLVKASKWMNDDNVRLASTDGQKGLGGRPRVRGVNFTHPPLPCLSFLGLFMWTALF